MFGRLVFVALALSFIAATSDAEVSPRTQERVLTAELENAVLTSTGSVLHFKSSAASDTFYLYGGPDEPTEGRFQGADGLTPDRQGPPSGVPGARRQAGSDPPQTSDAGLRRWPIRALPPARRAGRSRGRRVKESKSRRVKKEPGDRLT